ncbi:MAG: methyl-accepting chemotaxis protein [Oryzomonas sp.]|uniref:methyl-accepting chemotaxis protein n=1 Tax=Oryzomonas sp. TaxID=2855186 RepID=UPI00284977CC|nr:methyl-accepting chemotaxis protein [Oryzomonas sp.]MDR3581176.1 methyl-accepting chemotaxis protein [Oryzomonas sp.]
MNWSDLKVKTKLAVLVAMMCLVLAVVVGLGFYGISDTTGGIGETNESLKQVAVADSLVKDFLTIRLDLVYMMLLTDTGRVEEKRTDMLKQIGAVREGIKKIETTPLQDKDKELLKQFSDGFEAYLHQGEKLAKLALESAVNGGKDHASIINFATTSVAPLYAKPAEAIAKLVEDERAAADEITKSDMQRAKKFGITTFAIGFFCLGGAALFGFLISRSVINPITRVMEVLETVASGDLTSRTGLDSHDEMGILGRGVDQMTERLAVTIGRLSDCSIQVSVAADSVHKLADGLTRNSESLSSQSTTIATASEEMAATSSDIARNCLLTANAANKVEGFASESAYVVMESVNIMNTIAEQVRESAATVGNLGHRSEQIGEIVGTIEDIADQTNLLALNAAIEAARAGEQGRGFAVVADEVRALAERTTRATREISEMIKAIQDETRKAVSLMDNGVAEVERGVSESAKSSEALVEVLSQISEISSQVGQIATAAEQQTATTNDITNNIQQVNNVVIESAQGASQTAEETIGLSQRALEMQQLVEQFILA